MLGPPTRKTEADWCSVLHHATENFTIGRLMTPTKVRIAAARAAREGSSTVHHSAVTPRYIRNKTSIDVSRASHTQYVPHIGRPHSEPVMRQRRANAAPIGAVVLA